MEKDKENYINFKKTPLLHFCSSRGGFFNADDETPSL
jgi:hypothetical protein